MGAQESMNFIWVPVMKRMGIFKASSRQHEVSAIVARSWVQILFLCQNPLLLKKILPRVLLVASACPWAREEAAPREMGVRSWKRENKLRLASGNRLPARKKGGKRDFVASQPFAGSGGLGAALGMWRELDA